MIRKMVKYINYDSAKMKFRVVLLNSHIGYFMTLEEAVRHRDRHCIRLNIKVPDDVSDVHNCFTTKAWESVPIPG